MDHREPKTLTAVAPPSLSRVSSSSSFRYCGFVWISKLESEKEGASE